MVRLVVVLLRDTPVTPTVVALTVTVQVAVLLPSEVVTVIVAFPAATADTTPLDDTVATAGALLLHDTFLFVALEGKTVAERFSEPPTRSVVDVLFRDTPVTATLPLPPLVTVMEQVAVLLPSAVVTVMVALPIAKPLTKPFDDTDAIEGELLLHVTFLLVALAGKTVAVNVSEPPTVRLVPVLFKVTPVTATVPPPPLVTVMAQVAVLLPSAVVTVIVALPVAMPVTTPFDDTVAMLAALLLHVTF
jgi:hypothetical protein